MATASRWYLADYKHSWVDGTLHIWLLTDVPCHLALRWTSRPTWTHERADEHRGYGWMWDPHYCFVEWAAIEQLEPGDTLEHRFTFPGWAEGQERWWLFAGHVAGTRSPSISPIFHAVYNTYRSDESMRHTDLTDKDPAGVIDHADWSITPSKLKEPFQFLATPRTPDEDPVDDLDITNKRYVDTHGGGGGIWTPIFVADVEGYQTWTKLELPDYDMLMFRLAFSHTVYDHRAGIRFNEDTGNHYSTLGIYTRGSAGPSRSCLSLIDRLTWFTANVSSTYASNYQAIFQRMPWGNPGWIGHFTAGVGWGCASGDEHWTGNHVYSPNGFINAITIYNQGGHVFNMRIGIWGMSWT